MNFRTTSWLGACAVALLSIGVTEADPLFDGADLYHGFTRIDPSQQTLSPNSFVVVRGGKIVTVGSGFIPEGEFANRRNMSGHYALPGFIDAHGHLTAGPHALEMTDSGPLITIDSIEEVTRYHALVALATGVTTVRNPGADPAASRQYMAARAEGEMVGPDMIYAGAVIQPPPMGGNAFAYPQTPSEWNAEALRQAGLGASYFKLYHGLSEQELAAGIEAARSAGLEPMAHLDTVSWTRAAELGIKHLLHALPTSAELIEPDRRAEYEASRAAGNTTFMYRWFELVDFDGPLFQQLLASLVENDVTVDFTLVVNALTFQKGALSVYFPESEAGFYHPEARAGVTRFLAMTGFGWTEDDYQRAGKAMDKALEMVRRMDQAGVRIALGTDSAGGGPSLAREMALYVQAGYSPMDTLHMLTQRNAEVLDVDQRVGQVRPEFEADLVFLTENPAEDVMNTNSVAWVISDGMLYNSRDLLNQARSLLDTQQGDNHDS
ncbi:MAG: amidohydrolase family protein [Xanthomonadales bacterium]|nr:amidohydrolase family protein [Xanthomonadales bacterium]